MKNTLKEWSSNNKVVFISYGTAFTIILFIFLIFGVYPFGQHHILQVDASQNYAPQVIELFNKIKNGESLFYSWKGGLGTDFYYFFVMTMFNPVIYIGLLMDVKSITEVFAIIYLFQIPLCALTFSFFLKEKFGKKDIYVVLFSLMYAFCSFITAYFWVFYWINSVMLLPLIEVGLEKLIKRKTIFVYALTLGLGIISNYQLGIFLCCFSGMYYFSYLFKEKNMKENFRNTFAMYITGSLLAASIAAVVLIPAVIAFPTAGYSRVGLSEINPEVYFPFLKFLTAFYYGMTPSVLQGGTGLPNVYCGLLAFILLIVYFMNPKFPIRDKIINLICLMVMYLFFSINMLDFIIHGMHYSSGLPHRFSFIFVFYVLILGYQGFIHIGEMTHKRFMASAYIISGLSIILFNLFPIIRVEKPGVFTKDAITYNVILIIIYLAFLAIKRISDKNTNQNIKIKRSHALTTKGLSKQKKTAITVCIAGIIIVELASNTYNNFNLYKEVSERDLYISQLYEDIKNVKKEIDSDKSFYRMEQYPNRVFCDGKMYGFNGISIFSITYDSVVELFTKFGISSSVNKMEYRLNTPLLNSILSVKYALARESRQDYLPAYFQNVANSGKILLTENPYVLPVAFMVSNNVLEWDAKRERNAFVFQNTFIEKSTGISEALFSEPILESDTEGTLLTYEKDDNGIYQYMVDSDVSPSDTPSITYSYYINDSGRYYLNINGSNLSKLIISWEGDTFHNISSGLGKAETDTFDIGELKAGTKVTVKTNIKNELSDKDFLDTYTSGIRWDSLLSFIIGSKSQPKKQAQTGFIKTNLSKFNEDVFIRAYDTLSRDSLQEIIYSDTEINGTISVSEDGALFTSIPYDKRWKAYVDGYEIPTVRVMDALLGVELTEGVHKIHIQYEPIGIILSYIITLLSIVMLTMIEVVIRKKRKRKVSKPGF